LSLVTGQMKVLVGECFGIFANCIFQINMLVLQIDIYHYTYEA